MTPNPTRGIIPKGANVPILSWRIHLERLRRWIDSRNFVACLVGAVVVLAIMALFKVITWYNWQLPWQINLAAELAVTVVGPSIPGILAARLEESSDIWMVAKVGALAGLGSGLVIALASAIDIGLSSAFFGGYDQYVTVMRARSGLEPASSLPLQDLLINWLVYQTTTVVSWVAFSGIAAAAFAAIVRRPKRI